MTIPESNTQECGVNTEVKEAQASSSDLTGWVPRYCSPPNRRHCTCTWVCAPRWPNPETL
ncbi:hypothetical protein K440DRAFT_631704 [Wilcoxina mikolae CBS 423.85]|nr:hypothetical protein K440DRAFT_631704 [Wilcoxina mikolae CBS 423.85]